MSDPCYIECYYEMRSQAFNDLKIYHDREPTEEEIEEYLENLYDKYT